MKCPSCGTEGSGKFCSSCGTALADRHCTHCGAKAPAGARFCSACGAGLGAGSSSAGQAPSGRESRPAPLAAPGAGMSPTTLWGVTGGLLLLGIFLIVAIPRLGGGQPAAPVNAPFAGGAAGTGAPPDLSTMTPREAADRLWDRVVRSAEAGDSTAARQFVPMGIAAYERIGDLDADGLYHLSMLQRIGGDFEAAIASADQILQAQPDHILALAAAGEAALELGDGARANEYFQHLLDIYDSELGKALPEYEAHTRAMPGILERARASVGQR